MNILHVIDTLNIGGAERATVDLANASTRYGLSISFCTTRQAGALSAELLDAIQVYHLNRSKRFAWPAMKRFADIVIETKADIVHAHMRSTAALMTFLKTLGWLNVPVLFQDHRGVEIDESVPLWLSWWGSRIIDQYVGVYPKLCQWAKQANFHDKKIDYVGYAMDLSRLTSVPAVDLRQTFNLPPDYPIGVTVGNLRTEKGTDILIKAIAQSDTAKDAQYLIVGRDADPEYAQYCRDLVSKNGLQDIIHFVGLRNDVPSLLQGADFALMPSRSESGPLVLIEYMVAGLPFVSFNVGDLAYQISQHQFPGFALAQDFDAFTNNLNTLLQLTPAERISRGNRGRKFVEEHFNIKTKVEDWKKIYEKILTRSTK